jgi:HD-like signal output (HDOD) protein
MRSPLLKIVSDMRSLEPFPHVATSVLAMSSREDVVPDELIEVIQTDPALTGKVLRLCNSAYYGFQREIASLQEAGNMLGARTLTNLVLTSSAGKYFRDYGSAKGRSQEGLWERCVTHAVAARMLARQHVSTDPERAYTAGLLQNMGNMVLDRYCFEERSAVDHEIANGRTQVEAERVVLGVHHAEIGARLSTRWALPDVLVDTIRHHHSPDEATIDPVLTATIHLAEVLGDCVLIGMDPESLMLEACDAAYELTGLAPDKMQRMGVGLSEELEKARDLLCQGA